MAEKTWLLWHDAIPRVPSTREHGFSQSDESTAYEHVCLVTANSGETVALSRRIAMPEIKAKLAFHQEYVPILNQAY
jgi:hypothetical protein